jgi:hypothetical protein
MTTWPSNQTESVPTMAGDIPPTVASRAAAEFDATTPTATRPPYVPNLAWSAEPPESASPLQIERPRPWFTRSRVLTLVGGGLVAAAAAGVFGALHGTNETPVDTTNHNAPAPAPAPAVTPAPTAAPANPVSVPATKTQPATTTHSVMTSHGSSGSTSHQSPSRHSTSSSSGQHTNDQSWQHNNDQQWQSNHDSVSTPPTLNRNDFYYWFTHRRDRDDSRWTHDHGDSQSSHDQTSDNHSTGSNDNGSK